MTPLFTFRLWNILIQKIYFLTYYRYFFTIMIFVGFIISAPFTYFIPPVRYLAVFIIFVYLFINIFTNYWIDKKLFIFQMILISYISIQHSINQLRDFDSVLPTLLVMLFATAFIKNTENMIKILKFIVIINFIAMAYEVITFEYIIKIVEENKYESERMQGLFSYSKEVGYFLLIAFVFLRYFHISMFYKLLLFLSAIMSGSRTAIIAILVIDYIYQTHSKLNFKKLFKQYFYLFIIITMFVLFSLYYFTDKTEYMLFRILNSFNFESSSQVDRLYYWNYYFESLNNYSILNWIFGNGTYLNNMIGNGAENTYLMIVSQIGLAGLAIFVVPLLMVFLLFFNFIYYIIYNNYAYHIGIRIK